MSYLKVLKNIHNLCFTNFYSSVVINITKPFLPPKKEFDRLTETVWKRNWLTNNGPFVRELELNLKNLFSLDFLLLVQDFAQGKIHLAGC